MTRMFDAAACNLPACALQQHPNFAAALQSIGQRAIRLGDAPGLLAVQRRLTGGVRLALFSRVRVGAPERLREVLQGGGLHRHLILLSPDRPTPELARIGAVPLMTPGVAAAMDLRPPPEVRRAALHQKWRNRLVHAERQPLRVRRQNLPINSDHWLLQAETARAVNIGYRHWPTALTLAYARENRGAAKLFTAFEGDTAVAAMLFLRHGCCASYHIGHITARGRAVSAHNLLLWRASCWLADKGHDHLDLGLIDTVRAPGLARFKLGSGAQILQLGGTWGWWPPLGKTLRPLARLDRRAMLADSSSLN